MELLRYVCDRWGGMSVASLRACSIMTATTLRLGALQQLATYYYFPIHQPCVALLGIIAWSTVANTQYN